MICKGRKGIPLPDVGTTRFLPANLAICHLTSYPDAALATRNFIAAASMAGKSKPQCGKRQRSRRR